ncbi:MULTISPECIES: DNA-processing protein DprA [unclassified Microbacterium]|uniref:DNA-processing protein DprA n=1 Tax=unclassified Microbacterium TaxID=2609290 RepID=UPI000EAA01CC|nr:MULTISPECIES: DNA-processing protein DprA [unclassified Microbacterium]MBT2485739.1 DNA-processing protein DprA [Microbacterium sp. ISL-108]RKN68507.1 DNA-protecting protein DprA [Microbacterium sp. CGR2]
MMKALLDTPDTVGAAELLRPEGDVAEAVARAAWTVIAEPGDAVAGHLIAELGARAALEFALGDFPGALSAPDAGPGTVAHRALADARARWRPRADPRSVRDALRGACEVDATFLIPGDQNWPVSLDDLGAHAPIALWVRGRSELLVADPRVAIVGARASSAYGDHVAAELAGDLAATGAVVVSGGAYGIDGSAHRAALGVQGSTVAFLAGGVDRAYPAGHQALLRNISEQGAVVSEPPCGTAPTKWRFLARNRLIAALGSATVVVEADWRSGSLNTAGHAAALGRPLGAVPGPVTSASSAGCHRLLREYDAQCVTSAAEVRELWGGRDGSATTSTAADPDRVRLLDAMSARSRVPVSELARRSGLAPDRVRAILGVLELEGDALHDEGGWRRAPGRP